ncbi:hypothetical protein HYFRA_00008175 [Hymenoscyphus fraxineus]|uniref:Uncharacterized protein n=1 Tax=Hymenoscyphus fraxineus TaxID=746836 RepID=A0A9N9PUN5_9HELO|nr:hypothetical protein HYFRA_00008175 [Hymenoscyphus fraxineus]
MEYAFASRPTLFVSQHPLSQRTNQDGRPAARLPHDWLYPHCMYGGGGGLQTVEYGEVSGLYSTVTGVTGVTGAGVTVSPSPMTRSESATRATQGIRLSYSVATIQCDPPRRLPSGYWYCTGQAWTGNLRVMTIDRRTSSLVPELANPSSMVGCGGECAWAERRIVRRITICGGKV